MGNKNNKAGKAKENNTLKTLKKIKKTQSRLVEQVPLSIVQTLLKITQMKIKEGDQVI